MSSRTLLLVALALVALLGAVALLGPERPATDAAIDRAALPEAGATPDARPSRPDGLVAPEDRAERSGAPLAAESSAEDEPAPAVSSESGAMVRLQGVVTFARDGALAAGMDLAIAFDGDALQVRTDEEGRYTTERVVPPGVVRFWHLATDPANPHRGRLQLEPAALTIPAGASEVVEHHLRVLHPALWLDVDVVRRSGEPVEGATVHLERHGEREDGSSRHRIDRADTDASGRARFAIYDVGGTTEALVVARLEDEERRRVSPAERLEPGLWSVAAPPVVRLVLDDPAVIDVRVATLDGTGVRNRMVVVKDESDWSWWIGPRVTTDERGEARVEGLPGGTYRLRLLEDEEVPAQEVTVVAGERAEVVFEIPVRDQQLAAAGILVDEDGAPLPDRAVVVRCVESGETVWASTDAEGAFEAYAAPCATVRVSASRGVYADEFEPEELEAAFGATRLELRRTRDIQNEVVFFEVVDARSGELVRDVLVLVYREPRTGDVAFHRAADGRAGPRCPLDPATALVVGAPGYRRRALTLEDVMPDGGAEGPVRVRLQPGVLRELRIVDAEGGALAGVRVLDAGRLLGSTDADGRFVVELTEAPRRPLTIEHGAVHARWGPSDGAADVGPATIVLRGRD